MSFDTSVRVANSIQALEKLLDAIEAGERPCPDWIHVQGDCRLEKLPDAALRALVRRLHGCVLRGFKARPIRGSSRNARVATWRAIAANGFHDFSSQGWTKCYGSPFIENYDYLGDYLEHGLEGLDPYKVYSAVLGTHDYTIEDFIHTPTCEKVETVVEPMAGTGEFTYFGHFRYPQLRYILFDLDEDARDHLLARPWLEGSDHRYEIANVLDPKIWKLVKQHSRGQSLSYIGKQSHHLFGAQELHRLLDLGTQHVDYFILETPEPALVSDLDQVDLLTRDEMSDARLDVALVEREDGAPNPFTNKLGFELQAWVPGHRDEARTFFRYPKWTSWQPPMLVSLAELLDLDVFCFSDDHGDFIPVDHDDNLGSPGDVNFMLFRRRG
jgi:hypothetical protein